MMSNAIMTIINLLSIVSPEYQQLTLISQLNNFFSFDHNIFLLDSSLDFNRFFNSSESENTPQSVYVLKSVNGNLNGLEPIKDIKSKNPFLIVVPQGVNFEDNLNLLPGVKEIQRLNINMKIGVFFAEMVSSDHLQNLFEWCWKQQIINIFTAFYSPEHLLNIFNYNPFGTFNVKNVTDTQSFNSFFLSQHSNFQQYPIRIGKPEYSHPLHAFKVLWETMFSALNASFTITQGPDTNFAKIRRSDLFNDDTMDIVVFMHIDSNPGPITRINMYPTLIEDLVIVVPEAMPYPQFAAYLKNAVSDQVFIYSFITVAVVVLLLSFIRYIKKKKIQFFESVVDVLYLLMNDNGSINYHQLSRIEGFLIIPLTFVGFVIVNGILSELLSYLTRPVIQPQINTVEDIYKSTFTFLVPYWAAPYTPFIENAYKDGNWSNKFRFDHLEGEGFHQQMGKFNRSISFLITQGLAKSLLRFQKRLGIRGYHISQLHIQTFGAFPVNDNFPFIERLNEITHRLQSGGLWNRMYTEYLNIQIKDVLKRYGGYGGISEEVDIERFEFPMIIIYGWLAGIIVLIIEIIWKKFEKTKI